MRHGIGGKMYPEIGALPSRGEVTQCHGLELC
jgi:hypothetical protein